MVFSVCFVYCSGVVSYVFVFETFLSLLFYDSCYPRSFVLCTLFFLVWVCIFVGCFMFVVLIDCVFSMYFVLGNWIET